MILKDNGKQTIHYNTMEGGLVMIRKKTRESLPAIQHAGFLDGGFARRQTGSSPEWV
jgi:hypothetical protein